MKKKILFVFMILLISFYLFSEETVTTKLSGQYLGQQPPGILPELFAPKILSTGSHELDITFTPDGNEIFFTRSGPDWFSAILQFKKIKGKWTGPIMPVFSGKFQNNYPFVAPNGTEIYYNSQEPMEESISDNKNYFYISRLTESGWSHGKAIESGIMINHTETYVSVASNGNIYFSARYDDKVGCDIYMREYLDKNYGKPINIGSSINSKFHEFHSYVSPDESILLFDSNRAGGYGANDLYISFKLPNGLWSEAINLGSNINTKYSESRPYISPDGHYLFFCSNRLNSQTDMNNRSITYKEFQDRIDGPGNGNQDIYWVDVSIINKLKLKKQE